MFNKWRILKSQGRWLIYAPYETKHLAAGSFTYVVSVLDYVSKTYYMGQTKRWRDG